MTDEMIISFIQSIPNLAIAVWVIRENNSVIAKLLEMQTWMIEQLMALHPPQDEEETTKPSEK